jgi:hypothetical protein
MVQTLNASMHTLKLWGKVITMARKTKLTIKEKTILRKLGWWNTSEDGALLQHPNLSGMDSYLWDIETFEDALVKTQVRLAQLEQVVIDVRNSLAGVA